MLKIKRVYESRETDNGIRILVDKLWPRGLSKTVAGIDDWAKDLAPSDKLRRWFGHRPERWLEFRQKYMEELSSPEKLKALGQIARKAATDNVTLLFAARDSEHNNAKVLEELINNLGRNHIPERTAS